MPYPVLDQTVPTYYYKTLQQNGKTSTVTLAVHADDVPGEVVAFTSKESNAEGRLIRRSRMELVDYGFNSTDEGESRRRRARRQRRRSRRDR